MEFALGEVGLTPEQFWDMTWPEYDYAVAAYRTRLARNWEPTRELYALIYNMFAEKADHKTAQQLIPLFTDRPEKNNATKVPKETPQEFYRRMAANNFMQSEKQKEDTI